MAKKTALDATDEAPDGAPRTLEDAEAEIEALRAQLAAAGAAVVEPADFKRYPCVMYRAHKIDDKHPNGYERRRVQEADAKGELDVEKCDAMVVTLEKAGWVHSPADIAA